MHYIFTYTYLSPARNRGFQIDTSTIVEDRTYHYGADWVFPDSAGSQR